jgi:hypothetical protein
MLASRVASSLPRSGHSERISALEAIDDARVAVEVACQELPWAISSDLSAARAGRIPSGDCARRLKEQPPRDESSDLPTIAVS